MYTYAFPSFFQGNIPKKLVFSAYHISTDKQAFYEYHSSIMEPWDGPVILGSEVGVIDFPPEKIRIKGRLQPGKMFLVDTREGRIVDDNEIKGKIARQKPYRPFGFYSSYSRSLFLIAPLMRVLCIIPPMHIAAVQFDISWEDPKGSILSASTMLAMADLPAGTLAVLPEMFATGFSMNAELTLAAQAETEKTLSQLALSFGIFLCGGLVAKGRSGKPQNQAVLFGPDGIELGRYAKRHPFTPLEEEKTYPAGEKIAVIKVGDTRVSPLICYDLRFPEEFRAAAVKGAEVFLVLANWPAQRQDHWTTLLQARAIENQAFVVGVNRSGQDPHCQYAGGSIVISPHGDVLAQAGVGPQILTAQIDLDDLRAYRRDFPALRDKNSRIP